MLIVLAWCHRFKWFVCVCVCVCPYPADAAAEAWVQGGGEAELAARRAWHAEQTAKQRASVHRFRQWAEEVHTHTHTHSCTRKHTHTLVYLHRVVICGVPLRCRGQWCVSHVWGV